MSLQLNVYPVNEVTVSDNADWQDGHLSINYQDLLSQVMKDIRLVNVTFDLVRPGESARVIHVLDIIRPRIKDDGTPCFPGILARTNSGGEGVTNDLEGILVATCAFVEGSNPMYTPKEGVIDFSGPGAQLSPFSNNHLLVMNLEFGDGLPSEEVDESIRLASARIATVLAGITLGCQPNSQKIIDTTPKEQGLPAIGVIMQLRGEGPLRSNYIAGHPVNDILPTYVRYEQMADGLIMGENFTYASQKNYTCQYQKNDLLEILSTRNDLSLAGVVPVKGGAQTTEAKWRMASLAANLLQRLGAEGVIVTTEGAGNSHIDTMYASQECERRSICSVLLLNEMSDIDGKDSGFVDFVPEANAIVSVGNREEIVELPTVTRVLGGTFILGKNITATGVIKLPLRYICGATNEMGAWKIGAEAF